MLPARKQTRHSGDCYDEERRRCRERNAERRGEGRQPPLGGVLDIGNERERCAAIAFGLCEREPAVEPLGHDFAVVTLSKTLNVVVHGYLCFTHGVGAVEREIGIEFRGFSLPPITAGSAGFSSNRGATNPGTKISVSKANCASCRSKR